jgi:hypothetical protein
MFFTILLFDWKFFVFEDSIFEDSIFEDSMLFRGTLTCTPGIRYYPVPPFFLNMIGLKTHHQSQIFYAFLCNIYLKIFSFFAA